MRSDEVDFHIHSIYSDGALTPTEILEEALNKNLSCIAIADHNALQGTKELIKISKGKNIKCIPAVEIDTTYKERNFHILGYNFDINNQEFNEFVLEASRIKESVNIKLIEILEKNYPDKISLKEYINYDYDRQEGYWKTLHYLRYKGLIENLKEGKNLYTQYGPIQAEKELPSIEETCRQIHIAGGIAVLAHPGKVMKELNINDFKTELENIIKLGIDGIECYYPSHQEEIIKECLEVCKKNNMLITAGSDFHRRFGSREIGKTNNLIGEITEI